VRVLVVGGGLAGLTAAYLLDRRGDEVTVLEAADAPGGKLRRTEVGGVTVDVGAEAMLNRRPEGVDLARELGLEVVHPAVQSSRIWTVARCGRCRVRSWVCRSTSTSCVPPPCCRRKGWPE
jgi:oxygen-dependent protoporphyrinogen oxidase